MNKTSILKLIKSYPDIKNKGFEEGSEEQQVAALLVQQYIETYPEQKDNETTTALVLRALQDLGVRDYAMGLTNSDNLIHYISTWNHLTTIAPIKYRSAPASILSTVVFENGNLTIAKEWLSYADINYPLANLLRRVYLAGWEPKSMAVMRADLHPKVTASIFQGAN